MGRRDEDFVIVADWCDGLEIVAKDGTRIVGRGWDLHARIRWDLAEDWAVAGAVWGVEKGTKTPWSWLRFNLVIS